MALLITSKIQEVFSNGKSKTFKYFFSEDHKWLETIVRTRTLQAQVVTRARILLLKEAGVIRSTSLLKKST